ncbi:Protein-tyrosine phosphatase [Dictyocaulus viviparus]|uniref:Protein-tyrosine phosphatase n=1 Tax=Dictyocaulus viviparus TaxID=29172 RepID=A0A0D8XT29_DICVI|nr:Protein-tyrosine phosphatase [Dictyocaulus viviparus]
MRRSSSCDVDVEIPRDAPTATHDINKKNFSQLISSFYNDSSDTAYLNETQRHLKNKRMKLFAARTAIDVHPKLILSTKAKLTSERLSKFADNQSPGVLSLHAAQILETNGDVVADSIPVPISDARMRQFIVQCRCDQELVQNLAYDPRNLDLMSYIAADFDPRALQYRLALYNEQTFSDRDRVRLAGKYYNNIQLGKRMFGPSKKQKFVCSIIGGMERRFEILDNQVNHLPFTHEEFDKNLDKCRNQRVKCRDSSRVVLRYTNGNTNTFIHANYICGGPLFNKFILTQAPMENTIGDFWQMVWQEKVPYIFMLISRKEAERCSSYWPRRPESSPISICGLHIYNVGISSTRDPVFRVTYIRIVDDLGVEHRVEHWQADMNNSSNLISPLSILRLARNSLRPVIVHDYLGISRAACVVATEIAICNIIKGPTYKHPIQKAVHFLRLQRPFAVETPMQFIYIHRCVQRFFSKISGSVRAMEADYQKWLTERAGRMFLDDLNAPVPGYRLLSPRVDPDLLRLVRHPCRPNIRREAPDCVGESPLPLNTTDVTSCARRVLKI